MQLPEDTMKLRFVRGVYGLKVPCNAKSKATYGQLDATLAGYISRLH